MNYCDLRPFDSNNGIGIGTTIFFSGCRFHCPNCFNKEAQDFNYGKEFTKNVEDKLINYAKNKHVNHISILGGEPFHQDLDMLLNIVKRIKKEVNKPIYIWTGFIWETLLQDKKKMEILEYIDVITDGKFETNKKDINLLFKGSSNQKTIDVKKSLKQNKIIEYNWKGDV